MFLFKLKHYYHHPWKVSSVKTEQEVLGQKDRGKKHIDNLIVEKFSKNNLCQVMKLLIAIHVSFFDSHVNRWTGCSPVFLEGAVHLKMRQCWRDTERVRIWRSIYPCNFMGWFQGSCRTFRADGAYGSKGHDFHPHHCPLKEQTLNPRLMQYLLLEAVYIFLYFKI